MNGRRIPPIFIISISVLTRILFFGSPCKESVLSKGFYKLNICYTWNGGEHSNVDMYHVWALVFSNVSWK